MTTRTRKTRRRRRCATRRAGGVYAVVLALTMLITVIGLGALATARITSRATTTAVDWQQADHLAMSAVEQAISKMNSEAGVSPTTWRTPYTSGALAFNGDFGAGQIRWVLVDEDDGSIANNYCDPMRLYGVGRIGTTRRCFSVQLAAGGDAMDFLRTAMHCSDRIRFVSGSMLVLNGPISTNGDVSGGLSSLKVGTSEIAGSGAATKPMPSAGVFSLYYKKATVIPSSAASSGTFQPTLLSTTSNPYGSPNADGIYYLRLPDTVSTLKIGNCHIKATLLIENAAGSSAQVVQIGGDTTDVAPYLIEPSRSDYATLITKGIATVKFNGAKKSFDESGTSYASDVVGLVHTIGTGVVQLNDTFHLRGCLVADGEIDVSGPVGITATPSLYTTPPWGYSKGNRMLPVAGTWKWDAPPNGS
jgi:hypothetical protein